MDTNNRHSISFIETKTKFAFLLSHPAMLFSYKSYLGLLFDTDHLIEIHAKLFKSCHLWWPSTSNFSWLPILLPTMPAVISQWDTLTISLCISWCKIMYTVGYWAHAPQIKMISGGSEKIFVMVPSDVTSCLQLLVSIKQTHMEIMWWM